MGRGIERCRFGLPGSATLGHYGYGYGYGFPNRARLDVSLLDFVSHMPDQIAHFLDSDALFILDRSLSTRLRP